MALSYLKLRQHSSLSQIARRLMKSEKPPLRTTARTYAVQKSAAELGIVLKPSLALRTVKVRDF